MESRFLEIREYDTQLGYDIHKNIISTFFNNVNEYILAKHFKNKSVPFVIYKNLFPYIHSYKGHLIFWINPLYEKFYTSERVKSMVNTILGNDFSYNIFTNNIKDRSIRGITHYHIFFS